MRLTSVCGANKLVTITPTASAKNSVRDRVMPVAGAPSVQWWKAASVEEDTSILPSGLHLVPRFTCRAQYETI